VHSVEKASLDESFESKFWGQLRDRNSMGEFKEVEFTGRTHRAGRPGATLETLFNRFLVSLRRTRQPPFSSQENYLPMLIAAFAVVSTSGSLGATSMICSMVDGLASARPETALLALARKRGYCPKASARRYYATKRII